MLKKTLTISILLIPLVIFIACSGGSNSEDVCNAAVDKMFEVCNFDDADDQDLISNIVLAFGYSVSPSQVSALTKSEVKEECPLGEDEDDITGETKTEVMDALEDVVTCQDLYEGAQQFAFLF